MKAWNYLSGWTNFSLPKNIQKRLYKFLLRRAIGQFLEKELDLDNFDIGLMNGSVELRDLDLNLQTLNKLLNDTPFVLEEGRVGCIHASIPWTTLWSGDISLKIQGLHLALKPVKNKTRTNVDSSPPASTSEEPIMSSSLHFADDFLKSEIEEEQTQELHESIQKSFHTSMEDADMEGLQVLTKVIDKMLAKIKVDIIDTLIRISHKSAVPLSAPGDSSKREYNIDISIPRISYYDETPEFNNSTEEQLHDLTESSILLPTTNETIKFIRFTSPEIWLNSSNSMYSLHTQSETTINQDIEESLSQTEFFDTNSSMFSNIDSSGSITPKSSQPYKALLFTTMNKRNHIRLKLRPSLDDTSSLPIKQVDFFVTHMRATITPLQIAFFMDLMDSMSFEKSRDQMDKPIINDTDTLLDDLNSFQTTYTPLMTETPSQQQQQPQQNPDRKIKISLSTIELFVLGDDQHINDWNIPFDNKSHIKFAMEHTHVNIQQFPQGNSTLTAKITNIILAEWIKKPKGAINVIDRTRTQYEVYNPILLFTSKIKSYYRDDELFPKYDPRQPIRDEHQIEVIRIKFETKQSHENSRFIEVVPFDQDTLVEIQPFQLQIDPRIIDRYDNYIHAINDLNKRKEEEKQFLHSTFHYERRPSVFDDLKSQENPVNQKVRVRCSFIRVLLNVPDMSQTSTRSEFNDRFHKSQLSIDIKKATAIWSNTVPSSITEKLVSNDNKPTKINIELNYVNVFLQQDYFAETWFTAKTSQGKKVFSEGALCPTIEITIKDPDKSYHNASTRNSTFFGSGTDIPSTLFDYLNKNENFDADQKLHAPMEDQSETAMIFKQGSIENSTFVINCHLPQTHMHLTKSIWDKVQIIQNDLLLWQPKFLIKQQQMDDLSSSLHSSSMMSQSYERLAYHPRHVLNHQQNVLKTLISIVAVLSTGVWDIHTSSINHYCFKFSEFRYFAAMKHLGLNENITTLDIEELDLTDMSNPLKPIPLLYKTLPKTVNPKKETSMISLFSRLTSYPETNRIEKITSIVACNICWKATTNIDFIDQIIEFQKVPQEMIFIDPPTQYIKIFAHILETSIDYKPVQSPSRAVIILDGIQVITNILAGQSFIDIKTCIQSIELCLVDDVQDLVGYDRLIGKTSDARKYWSTLGFANIVSLLNVELQTRIKLNEHAIGPQADVSLVSADIGIDSNTDSFHTLLNFITFCANQGDEPAPKSDKKKKKEPYRPHQINTKVGDDLLSSLDENAFRTSPTSSKISPPTLIEAPDMEEFSYMEEFYKVDNEPVSTLSSSSIFINHIKPPTKPRRKHRVRSAEDIIRVLVSPDEDDTEPFQLVENYFGVKKKVHEPKSAVDINKAVLSLRVSNVNLIWKLYDGYEWDYIKTEMANKNLDGAPEEKNNDDVCIEIKLDSISLSFDLMAPKDNTALYFQLKIKDVEIIDSIKTSNYKKFLGYMRPPLKEKPREIDACMVDLELISLRPVLDDPQQEFRLKVKMLPVRLYVDHDALNFLVKYFTFEKSYLKSTYAANQSINKNNQEELDEEEEEEEGKELGMFFQYVDIYPITLKVDYKPKYINYGNIKDGQLAELVNLFHLDGAEMNLTHVKLTGIKGMDGLLERLSQEWLPHIKNTQVTNMVSGVSPIRSIVNLSSGVADLVILPIQQYRKDGRIIKGIQKGTSSFARATAIEAIKLSSRVATGTQVILEHADGFLSPTSPNTTAQLLQDQHFVYINDVDIPNDSVISEEDTRHSRRPSISHSPSDITEGIQFAYQNLSSAAQTIFAVPTEEEYDHGKSTTKSVIRAVPIAVIKPMIGLTGAFQSILTGLRNSIDPVMRLQSEDKYKKRK